MRLAVRALVVILSGLFLVVTAALTSASASSSPIHQPKRFLRDTSPRARSAAGLKAASAPAADLSGKSILVYGPAGTGGLEESAAGATYTVWDAAT